MPLLTAASHRIHYDLHGPQDAPTFVLVNGLTQYSNLWQVYREALAAKGFCVATFDLLGQGQSDKPALFISQDEQVAALGALVEALGKRPVFVAGISFGALIALRYAIEHGESIAGLVAMSAFAELSPQLTLLGTALRNGLVLGGVGFLQDLLLPMNLSDTWLGPRLDQLEAIKAPGWRINDLYALQNLMESFLEFQPLAERLGAIKAPTLILNGEFDFLTPRSLHETLRVRIPDSALVIVPRAYHAFTLEKPELTAHLMHQFADEVRTGAWVGGQSVWIAPEQAGGKLQRFPAGYDHLRAIPVRTARGKT